MFVYLCMSLSLLCFSVCLCLSLCLSISLCLSLLCFFVCLCMSLCLCVCVSPICFSVCLFVSVHVCVSLFLSLSMHMHVCRCMILHRPEEYTQHCSIPPHFLPGKQEAAHLQVLFLNLEMGWWPATPNAPVSMPHSSGAIGICVVGISYMDTEDLNSHPHACTISASTHRAIPSASLLAFYIFARRKKIKVNVKELIEMHHSANIATSAQKLDQEKRFNQHLQRSPLVPLLPRCP